MIPTIETIVEDLLAGTITKQQAVTWLHQHAADAGRDLRDDFAAHAMQGAAASQTIYESQEQAARDAYAMADAMLAERERSK